MNLIGIWLQGPGNRKATSAVAIMACAAAMCAAPSARAAEVYVGYGAVTGASLGLSMRLGPHVGGTHRVAGTQEFVGSTVEVGDRTFTARPGDEVSLTTRFPASMPDLGIGSFDPRAHT